MGILSVIKSAFIFNKNKKKPSDYKRILDSDQPDIILSKISGHNMSMNIYKITAVYKPTNRSRTVRAYGISEEDAISQLNSDYLLPPKKVLMCEYDMPSREQISYMCTLGINIPNKCCKEDASALISMKLEEFKNANSIPTALSQFANHMKIPYSLYLNEPHMINYIHGKLSSPEEKIAMMIAAMYRKKNKKWNFCQWEEWVKFGQKAYNDKSFIRSLQQIESYPPFYGFEKDYNSIGEKTIVYQTIDTYLKYL